MAAEVFEECVDDRERDNVAHVYVRVRMQRLSGRLELARAGLRWACEARARAGGKTGVVHEHAPHEELLWKVHCKGKRKG